MDKLRPIRDGDIQIVPREEIVHVEILNLAERDREIIKGYTRGRARWDWYFTRNSNGYYQSKDQQSFADHAR